VACERGADRAGIERRVCSAAFFERMKSLVDCMPLRFKTILVEQVHVRNPGWFNLMRTS
jgi:hypothetical protein